jgi:hypothetical protein
VKEVMVMLMSSSFVRVALVAMAVLLVPLVTACKSCECGCS